MDRRWATRLRLSSVATFWLLRPLFPDQQRSCNGPERMDSFGCTAPIKTISLRADCFCYSASSLTKNFLFGRSRHRPDNDRSVSLTCLQMRVNVRSHTNDSRGDLRNRGRKLCKGQNQPELHYK